MVPSMKQFRPLRLCDVAQFTTDGLIRFRNIQRWYVLGAFCQKCKHLAELDRFALERRYGKATVIYEVEKRLVCKHCKNGWGNTIIVINQWPR